MFRHDDDDGSEEDMPSKRARLQGRRKKKVVRPCRYFMKVHSCQTFPWQLLVSCTLCAQLVTLVYKLRCFRPGLSLQSGFTVVC